MSLVVPIEERKPMRAQRDEYNIDFRPSWWQVWCAIFGHNLYRTRTWYSNEWGCQRCGMHFEHRWDMFTSTHTHD